MRTVIGIIVGYLVFGIGSTAVVATLLSGEGIVTVVVALVALLIIGAIVGWVTTRIARGGARKATAILAGIVAVITLANLLLQLGAEPNWYKIGTLVLTAPAIFLHGRRAGSTS